MPVVSVILPFHNAASTLAAAVASIQTQSFTDWELIAFDDGSADGSADIVQALGREDRRIRLIAAGHRGLITALQEACGCVRGTYLARMDADDIAHPDRLARQAALLDNDAALGLCGTQVLMTGERVGPGRRRYEAWINSLVTHDDLVRELFVECPLPHPTFMMRREVYEQVGGYRDRGWPEDYDLVMRIWRAGWRLGKVAEELLEWRDSAQRLSMTDARYSEAAFRALKRHYLEQRCLRGGRRFYQWGAGEVGKRWLREWDRFAPEAVVDIHPRKIGRRIHHTPVIAPEALPPPGEAFVVVMVGAPGARDEIREWFGAHAYQELRDYRFLA